MAVGVGEDAGVPAPERLAAWTRDRPSRPLGLIEDGVDLGWRAHVVGERNPSPAAGVLDAAVLRELVAAPERDDEPARLEEDDVVAGRRMRGPAEHLGERPRPAEITD